MTNDGTDGGAVSARRAVARLLTAIESRDLRAIAAALHPDATWQNVPRRVIRISFRTCNTFWTRIPTCGGALPIWLATPSTHRSI